MHRDGKPQRLTILGPVPYYDLHKIQVMATTDTGSMEAGYTSYTVLGGDTLYIELVKVRPEFRRQRIAEYTLFRAVAITGKYRIHTKGLTVAGEKFLSRLAHAGLLSIEQSSIEQSSFDTTTIFISESGMQHARMLYNQEQFG